MHDNKLENQAIELVVTGLSTDYPSHSETGGPGTAGRGSHEMGRGGNSSGISIAENYLN